MKKLFATLIVCGGCITGFANDTIPILNTVFYGLNTLRYVFGGNTTTVVTTPQTVYTTPVCPAPAPVYTTPVYTTPVYTAPVYPNTTVIYNNPPPPPPRYYYNRGGHRPPPPPRHGGHHGGGHRGVGRGGRR